MQAQSSGKPYDDINITPMLDLAYVLLIIFIVMTTAMVQGIKVDLPKASNTPSLSKPKTVSITITSAGAIHMDAVPVTLAELETKLQQKKASEPEFPVVVRGDGQTFYRNVVDVLALLQRLDITQMGLATQRVEP